jgi:hypothetical protein
MYTKYYTACVFEFYSTGVNFALRWALTANIMDNVKIPPMYVGRVVAFEPTIFLPADSNLDRVPTPRMVGLFTGVKHLSAFRIKKQELRKKCLSSRKGNFSSGLFFAYCGIQLDRGADRSPSQPLRSTLAALGHFRGDQGQMLWFLKYFWRKYWRFLFKLPLYVAKIWS